MRIIPILFITIAIGLLPLRLSAFTGGENWDYEAAELGVEPSYTLPVLHIFTEDGQVIDQKENYIPAKCWLDAGHIEGIESLGSPDEMIDLGIRGRGNATWKMDKKPYKLKFDKKQVLMGMPKNKHFALLAFVGGSTAYFAHPLGMEIGRSIIKGWTPQMHPVEVVLNGQYIGLYVLTETVRIDSGRVDIFEQPEDNDDIATIDGGYLVEIDNYSDENQLVLWENDTTILRVTAKTPEPMNELHADFITRQFNAMTAALYDENKLSRSWEEYIDLDSYVRHFVVEEIMHNIDAYNGSCYLHKDLGGKWTFGPLWDLGDSFDLNKDDFTFNVTPFRKTWIPQAYSFPRFVKHVQEVWAEFKAVEHTVWEQFVNDWCISIAAAEERNQQVWKYYRGTSAATRMEYALSSLRSKVDWLDSQWGAGPLTCNVSFDVEGDGRVLPGGVEFADVDVFKGDSLTIEFIPDQDHCVESLVVNGRDLTSEITNGAITLYEIDSDTSVEVTFDWITSVADAVATGVVWRLNDGVVEANAPVSVYTASGAAVGSGTSVSLPARGVYVVKSGIGASKIVF